MYAIPSSLSTRPLWHSCSDTILIRNTLLLIDHFEIRIVGPQGGVQPRSTCWRYRGFLSLLFFYKLLTLIYQHICHCNLINKQMNVSVFVLDSENVSNSRVLNKSHYVVPAFYLTCRLLAQRSLVCIAVAKVVPRYTAQNNESKRLISMSNLDE